MMAFGTTVRNASPAALSEGHDQQKHSIIDSHDDEGVIGSSNSSRGPLQPIPLPSNENVKKSSGKPEGAEDATESDMNSEGSLGIEDLLGDHQAIDSDIESDSDNEEGSLDPLEHPQHDQEGEADSGVEGNPDNDRLSQCSDGRRSSSAPQHRQRRRDRKTKDWENLSSCTVYSQGNESCIFDMSSRSLLDDCDFDIDDDFSPEDETSKPTVRFSAGSLRSSNSSTNAAFIRRNQGAIAASPTTPMSRITEHTRESSLYGSQSDTSGRLSFASAASPGAFGSFHKSIESRHREALSSGGLSPSPTGRSLSSQAGRRCDVLNIHDLKSLTFSEE